jgi:predicted Fe-Mo cluster-binding NifX family protein
MNAQQETPGPNVRIAIPIMGGRLHDHFGGCTQFAIVDADLERKRILSSRPVTAPPHEPGLFPSWLREQGVQAVIVGGIGRRALDLFAKAQIEVRSGRSGSSIEELVNEFMAGTLTGAPNACASHGHHHDHAHGEGEHHLHPPAA